MPTKRLSGQRIASGIRFSPEQQPISKIRALAGCRTSKPASIAATDVTAGSDEGWLIAG
jgi:hypothetical protein